MYGNKTIINNNYIDYQIDRVFSFKYYNGNIINFVDDAT